MISPYVIWQLQINEEHVLDQTELLYSLVTSNGVWKESEET